MRRLLVALLLLAGITVVVRGQIPCDVVTAQPACYVALLPGPAEDTLGIVTIDGAPTYDSSGQLLLTTVAVDSHLDIPEFFQDVFSSRVRTVERSLLYPDGESEADVAAQNQILMQNSQLDATLAGLQAAGYDVNDLPGGAEVVQIVDGAPIAEADIAVGDVVVSVDGTDVSTSSEAVDRVRQHAPGDPVELTIERDGQRHTITVAAGKNPEDPSLPYLGVLLRDHVDLPVDVSIDAGNIGGPSAGMMFALSIVDLLDPADLTGGRVIAGTGTIDRDGVVGPIGGIQQKIIGATSRDAPADVFLVPQANFDEAQRAAVDRQVTLVPIATLADSLAALRSLNAGQEPSGAVALGP